MTTTYDLSSKPNFEDMSGTNLVHYNNAMVREILGCGLTGYREVTVFQNKDAGVKRCEANWSSLVAARQSLDAILHPRKAQSGRTPSGAADVAPKPKVVTPGQAPTVAQAAPAAPSISKEEKSAKFIAMLTAGATVDDMCAALGWQAHTLRARISTSKLKVERSRKDGVTSYRIVA
jgi:hypothetical protein